ncbi:MAG: hypothetical protein J6866_07605, partial [Victivallales bacterium]|nr:hypothetical protein [Victivallales bacterium]
MNKITSSLLAAFGLLTIAVSEAAASLASDILAAVDAPSTITYLGSTYVKYKLVKDDDGAYSIATDDNWDPIIDKRTTECKWEIQKKEVVNTFPKQGSSCLHSTIGTGKLENDAQYAALTFQVTGPGIFSFWYKTSTFSAKTSDYLTVIVDGKDMNFTAEGYDEYGDGSVTWEQCSIEIPGGTYDQDDGTRQYSHSSPYEHEVTFIFYKDEPAYDYDWDKDKFTYVEDGPEGIGWEKDKDLGEDPYWGPKSVYETA